jgi:hypothetical protein
MRFPLRRSRKNPLHVIRRNPLFPFVPFVPLAILAGLFAIEAFTFAHVRKVRSSLADFLQSQHPQVA